MEYTNATVLIIDDKFDNIKVVMETLKPLKCELLYATSGQQGIERAQHASPDLILLDIMMPLMDGYSVCKHLKNDLSLKAIPVIFLTAKDNTEDVLKGFEVGAVDYIAKPFHSAELLARVKTHLDLKQSNNTLQLSSLSMEEANDAIYWISEDGFILYANAMAHEMLGYAPGDLLNKSIGTINPVITDLAYWKHQFINHKSKGSTRSRNKHKKSDGTMIDVEVSTRFISQNHIDYAVAIERDITEQIEFQKKLENWNEELAQRVDAALKERKEAERLIKSIYDAVDIGIALVDKEGLYVQLNRKYSETYGYRPDEMLGRSFLMVIPEEKREDAIAEHREFMEGKDHISLEKEVVRADGNHRTVLLSSSRLVRDDNKAMRIVVIDDITDQKRLEAKHQESEQLLLQQSKMAAMGEMLSMIAHQWRQPLNVINATTIRLSLKRKMGKLTDESFETAIKQIQNYSQKMSETIDDFSQFCRPNQARKAFTLTELFDEISSLVSAQLEYHNIAFETEIKEDGKMFGHFNELSHVLINLVTNAKDALDDKHGSDKKISLQAEIESDVVQITCSDNGGGISEEILDRIFEPYFTTKPEGKGTGIGLYMVKTIIEHHFNGQIFIENRDGGTTFSLYFPLARYKEE